MARPTAAQPRARGLDARDADAPRAARTEGSVSVSALDDDGTHRDLLTPSQLADRWGVTTGHLANLRHHGEGIGYLKIGSRVAYRFSDVVAFENAHYVSVG
jgi:hypothetical protein